MGWLVARLNIKSNEFSFSRSSSLCLLFFGETLRSHQVHGTWKGKSFFVLFDSSNWFHLQNILLMNNESGGGRGGGGGGAPFNFTPSHLRVGPYYHPMDVIVNQSGSSVSDYSEAER